MTSANDPLVSSESHRDHHNEPIASRAKIDAVLRLLKGESVDAVSKELGVTVRRIERWKSSFVEAGSAELAKRKSSSSKSGIAKHLGSIRQWIWLLAALVAVISVLVLLMQRGSPE